MLTLDIFKNDAFSLAELTAAINEMPFVPGQAGKLGIFAERGVSTTRIEIENRKGTLALIPNTPRGGVGVKNTRDPRNMRIFIPPHLKPSDEIYAEEIQNKRPFGKMTELQTAQGEVSDRMQRMLSSLDATVEYGRIGALKGVVYDADGATVIYNYFTEFGVAQISVDFVLGTATTSILAKCMEVREKMQEELGQQGGDDLEVVVFCGKTWFEKLITHAEVKEAYKHYESVQQALNPLQQDLRYRGFKFGGLTFVVYRGNVSGVPFVAAGEAHAFPVNVPGLFETYFAPADYMETVNTPGLPRYAKMAPDPSGFNRFWAVETQSNPLSICTRPRTLVKLITSN